MTLPPPTPPPAPSPAARYVRKLLRRLAILGLIVAVGYALLIGAWIILQPRW
jgi:hypothetical protein